MVDIASMTHEAKPNITHRAVFAGREYDFCLSSPEIVEELERLCRCGIGEIALRIGNLRFTKADIREPIRLGLMGAGLPAADATALVMFEVDPHPLDDNLQLAAEIVGARVWGSARTKKRAQAEPTSGDNPPQ